MLTRPATEEPAAGNHAIPRLDHIKSVGNENDNQRKKPEWNGLL